MPISDMHSSLALCLLAGFCCWEARAVGAGGKRGEVFFFLFLWLSLLGHGSGVAVLLTESHIPCQVAPASAAARTGSGRPLLLQAWLVTAFLLSLAPSLFASPSLLISRKPTNTLCKYSSRATPFASAVLSGFD